MNDRARGGDLSQQRLPVGAEPRGEGTFFRVWAPMWTQVEVLLDPGAGERIQELAPEEGGYFSALVPGARPGMLYLYRLGGKLERPDPASRFQPEGPLGPSEIIDPDAYAWHDTTWQGLQPKGQIIYEMHVGTFTQKGTWTDAIRELPVLAELGITTLELLPVADFVGRFGWGYDGVDLYAPTRIYGRPDDFRAFVDEAHRLGLGVILDVVYNHLGPEGNYLKDFSPQVFSDDCTTDWGQGFNFDGPDSGPVREFFIANAGYWIDEFHLDGLRIDATQNICDRSGEHVLAAISRRARKKAGRRSIYLVAENEPQRTELLLPVEQGGYGMDALWNDDFHHSAIVALTGKAEAYYSAHRGTPQEFVSAAKHGFLYQGQYYSWQNQPRGSPTAGIPPHCFVNYLDNHDQVANSGRGYRCHMLTSPGRIRAMTALLLLSPQTPMLFQGQEYAASTFHFYFADHWESLSRQVKKGRAEFLAQFRSLANPVMQRVLPDPADPDTFVRSKLEPAERHRNREAMELHRSLIALRQKDRVFRNQMPGGVDGAVLGPEAFLLRYYGDHDTRLMLVNLGIDLLLEPAPEPLLAPPVGARWEELWSSEDPAYGGRGTPLMNNDGCWWVPGHAAMVLRPLPLDIGERQPDESNV